MKRLESDVPISGIVAHNACMEKIFQIWDSALEKLTGFLELTHKVEQSEY